MTYDAVVFDNDGVLVDLADRDVLRAGVRRAFTACGIADPDAGVVDSLVSGVTVDHLDSICDDYGLDPDRFWLYRDLHSSIMQRRAMREGAKKPYADVTALDSLSLPMGVVSSNQQRTVTFALEHFGLDKHVTTAYGRPPKIESLRRKKPNPHYLDRALDDLDAETALFVGDSETDVEAAQRAGVDSAFIRRSHREGDDLSVDPTYEIESLTDVISIVEPDRKQAI
jgi:HAD superfamily hydrolase (TIGR01549 family)